MNGYYSGYPVRPRKWRRAVRSHSRYDPPNYCAFSQYIDSEETMHHTERKSFELPCGMTVAESWGGLRKAWLGFKIALANKDTILMTHYATFIRKVQTEMGIQVTQFDPGILDESDNEIADNHACETSSPNDGPAQERLVDYDSMMEGARCIISRKHETVSVRPQNIFKSSINNSTKACVYTRKSSAYKSNREIYRRRAVHISKSCIRTRSIPIRKNEKIEDLETYKRTLEVEVNDDDCFYTRPNIENSELVKDPKAWQNENYNEDIEKNGITGPRRSCSYERKG